MITKFKLYEQLGGYNLGDIVLILYQVPKTNKKEMVPVKIITEDGIHYQFSFDCENNPFQHQRPIPYDKTMVINKTEDQKEPYKPSWTQEQPVGTDYSPAARGNAGGITNDFVLPNS
jgi:hypothetical protein